MTWITCDPSNYRAGRAGKIQYIVVHYTAGNGDTARNNGNYFHNNKGLGASAHFFVDSSEVVQSVAVGDTAWHCGASSYRHAECRNANSIGVELCSRKDRYGHYCFDRETVGQAEKLVRSLMGQYGIGVDRVLRHYDVTGKNCPAPFVDDPAAWTAFKRRLEVKPMTTEEAKKIIQEKAGLEDKTIEYLNSYIWRDALLVKLAEAMK